MPASRRTTLTQDSVTYQLNTSSQEVNSLKNAWADFINSYTCSGSLEKWRVINEL